MDNRRINQATQLIRINNENREFLQKIMKEMNITDERLRTFNHALTELRKKLENGNDGNNGKEI